jgi:hypothetical protein
MMNISSKDAAYIFRALQALKKHEPSYPLIGRALNLFGTVANAAGTELAEEKSWWEEQTEKEMREREEEREQWMDEQPF